jgi:hypothetical protein
MEGRKGRGRQTKPIISILVVMIEIVLSNLAKMNLITFYRHSAQLILSVDGVRLPTIRITKRVIDHVMKT